ncbi:tetratricopeptide repeat protein, partial [Micromonospora sicca]
MSSGFGELTVQAHHLVSAGDLAGAQRLLADALTDADPRPANASPELADAAGLQARVLVALGEPHSARGWAAFAYAAATRLYGRADERTITAAATLAAVLHRVGSDARAARLYSDVIIELTARDGPESMRVLAAHADLATVEYARGQCEVARDRLQDAWELHREVYGDGHPSGIKMLAKLGAMERDCGRYSASHEHLTLAEELCRAYLPADDPLAAQVAALSRAAADPDHVCADPEPPA